MIFKNIKVLKKSTRSLSSIKSISKKIPKEKVRSPGDKIIFFSITKAFKDIMCSGGMVSLDNSFELSVLFRRLGWRLLSASFPAKKVKFTSRLRTMGNFAKHLLSLRRRHGSMFVVKYLKASQLAVQKFIAGTPLTSLREVGGDLPFRRLDSRGLPMVIPYVDRKLIAAGSPSVIR